MVYIYFSPIRSKAFYETLYYRPILLCLNLPYAFYCPDRIYPRERIGAGQRAENDPPVRHDKFRRHSGNPPEGVDNSRPEHVLFDVIDPGNQGDDVRKPVRVHGNDLSEDLGRGPADSA